MSDETMTMLESMARALCSRLNNPDRMSCGRYLWTYWLPEARAALRALGMTDEMMQQPVGSVVCVPVAMTEEMLSAACEVAVEFPEADDQMAVYRAAIAARPGAGDRG